ncbi:hypothetical protein [Mycobacteroides abscessus]|uniref:hypothetical protein n=2 Tax=Mycobacteroides abscessus TaxID=36809 RepID=UPI0011C39903|nr:hypothetical protein [Mycobacteroides abscessus]
MYAQRATDDSFGRLGGHLPPDAISALSAMDTLNMVVAVLNAILALALVGGIMLLRRKPAGRMVVAVAASFLLLAPFVTYVVSTQIWSRLVTAMSETLRCGSHASRHYDPRCARRAGDAGAGGVAVVHWWPRSSPGGPSNAQEAPKSPVDRFRAESSVGACLADLDDRPRVHARDSKLRVRDSRVTRAHENEHRRGSRDAGPG